MGRNFARVIPDNPATPPAFLTLEDMVQRSAWAAGLDPSALDHVLGSMQERHVPAGGFMAQAGDPVEHWSGVIGGFVKMSVTTADGRISTLTGAPAGSWFGEGSLLKHEARRYDVVALRSARVALMPRRTFEWLRQTCIPFNHYLQDLLNARLGQFVGMLKSQRLQDPDARVAHCLAGLFDTRLCPRAPCFLEINQEEVGLLANISRQRANVALQRLQALQLIRIEWGGLTALDPAGLQRLSLDRP